MHAKMQDPSKSRVRWRVSLQSRARMLHFAEKKQEAPLQLLSILSARLSFRISVRLVCDPLASFRCYLNFCRSASEANNLTSHMHC